MATLANAYSREQLIKVLKSNRRPDGTPLKGPMRGRLRGLTDQDYDALWSYISTHK